MSYPISFPVSPLILSLALATAGYAAADENDPDTVLVLGDTYRNTATKTALEPEETPQGISVVDSEEIEQQGADSVDQALRYVSGVNSEVRGGAVKMFDTFTIRGFDVNHSYYDGLPLQYLTGWNLMPQIDPLMIERVEVFKGPTSVLYGAMPPGGMVNILAKEPQQEDRTTIGVATGTGTLREADLDTTGQLGLGVSYRIIGLAKDKESQVETASEERYLVAPSVDVQVSEQTLLNVNVYYQHDPDMGINSTLPADAMFINTGLGSTSPSTYAGDENWREFDREVLMVGYKVNHEFNDQWTYLQKFRATDSTLAQKNTYHTSAGYDASTGSLQRNIYSTDEALMGIAIDNQLAGKLQLAGLTHNVLVGTDYQKFLGAVNYKEYSTSDSDFYSFNIYSPNNNLLDTSTLTETLDNHYDITLKQLGFYLQDQLTWKQLVLIAGLRYDWYESESIQTGTYLDSSGNNVYTSSEATAKDAQASYRVGALYALNSGLSPFASFATSFEPQTGLDADGNNFDSEKTEQIEAGLKFASPNKWLTATLSAFTIKKKDALVTNPDDVYGAKLQVGETVAKGIEFDTQLFLSENADVKIAYTYLDMEITKDPNDGLEGTTPIWVPKNSASLWANYHVLDGLLSGSRWGGGVRYVGKTELDALNTGKVPDYTLVDFSVSYDLGELFPKLDGASTTVAVNNLLNKEYYSCYDEVNCWYGEERTIKVSLDYTF